jgi:hypothetical protein
VILIVILILIVIVIVIVTVIVIVILIVCDCEFMLFIRFNKNYKLVTFFSQPELRVFSVP